MNTCQYYMLYTCQVHKFKYSIPDTDEEITIFFKEFFFLSLFFGFKKNLTSGWLQTHHVATQRETKRGRDDTISSKEIRREGEGCLGMVSWRTL